MSTKNWLASITRAKARVIPACVMSAETLDECPMVYKRIEDIVDNISPTVDVVQIIKPEYNFKAAE